MRSNASHDHPGAYSQILPLWPGIPRKIARERSRDFASTRKTVLTTSLAEKNVCGKKS